MTQTRLAERGQNGSYCERPSKTPLIGMTTGTSLIRPSRGSLTARHSSHAIQYMRYP